MEMTGLPMVRPDQRHNADRDGAAFSVAMPPRSGPFSQRTRHVQHPFLMPSISSVR